MDHTDYFSSSTASSTSGSWPRVSLTRNERIIPDTPLYFSVGGEFAGMLSHGSDTAVPDSNYNRDVNRIDFTPQVRFPFKRWQWFFVPPAPRLFVILSAVERSLPPLKMPPKLETKPPNRGTTKTLARLENSPPPQATPHVSTASYHTRHKGLN